MLNAGLIARVAWITPTGSVLTNVVIVVVVVVVVVVIVAVVVVVVGTHEN